MPQRRGGLQGTPGITKITLTPVSEDFSHAASIGGYHEVECPAGRVVGGGFSVGGGDVDLLTSEPNGSTNWRVFVVNHSAFEVSVRVWAVCMTTDPGAVIAKAGKFQVAKKH